MRQFNPTMLAMGAIVQCESTITGMDFHEDGQFLVAACRSGAVYLINSLSGVERKKLFTKSAGGGIIKYSHHESCILMTCEKAHANDVRYLSIHDNTYLRYFTGHSGAVSTLDTSPIQDMFVSGSSADRTVCLWDVRAPKPTHRIALPTDCQDIHCCFSAEGAVLMTMAQDRTKNQHYINLYDVKQLDNGPFADIAPRPDLWDNAFRKFAAQPSVAAASTHTYQGSTNAAARQHALTCSNSSWTSIETSTDGLRVLVGTSDEYTIVLDAMGGDEAVDPIIIHTPKQLATNADAGFGVAYSADSRFIMCANEDNGVGIFDVDCSATPANASNSKAGTEVATLNGHSAPVGHVKCNPKYDVVATACQNVALWIEKN